MAETPTAGASTVMVLNSCYVTVLLKKADLGDEA